MLAATAGPVKEPAFRKRESHEKTMLKSTTNKKKVNGRRCKIWKRLGRRTRLRAEESMKSKSSIIKEGSFRNDCPLLHEFRLELGLKSYRCTAD